MVDKDVAEPVGGLRRLAPTGTSVLVEGELKETPEGTKQAVELKATKARGGGAWQGRDSAARGGGAARGQRPSKARRRGREAGAPRLTPRPRARPPMQVLHVGPCDAATYPMAKKKQTLEFLREKAHLRPRCGGGGMAAGPPSHEIRD
jgi:asparaginyl-tRNA synthetase